ncbi:hypothetical protein Nepgr_023026 [Nepenthes gracilis]|uniref:Uncharacterized protein n=1 Tax=Nepenthes gracilis TaxID=150966 RepID=A0AAD3T263_NEPGR|nr:hypothetical protein Nepgr_023026 [Nepenthes gracilis]
MNRETLQHSETNSRNHDKHPPTNNRSAKRGITSNQGKSDHQQQHPTTDPKIAYINLGNLTELDKRGRLCTFMQVDVLEPLPCHSSSDQVPMPEVVLADPPLHRGPAAIGSSSRPPDSSSPPGPGSPSRCSEPSSSLKIRLGRSSSEPGLSDLITHPPPVIPVDPLVIIHGVPPAETPGGLKSDGPSPKSGEHRTHTAVLGDRLSS